MSDLIMKILQFRRYMYFLGTIPHVPDVLHDTKKCGCTRELYTLRSLSRISKQENAYTVIRFYIIM